jgi:hypothetical protein
MEKEREDGVNAGARNFGRLMLALIPYALGLAALVWLSFYIGAHKFRRELSQEERAAVYVGAQQRPTQKLKIEVVKRDCSTITRSDVDGEMLLIYARNDCHENLSYFSWHWEEVSPSGTVIGEGYENSCPNPTFPGDSAECSLHIASDDRASLLRIWTAVHSY